MPAAPDLHGGFEPTTSTLQDLAYLLIQLSYFSSDENLTKERGYSFVERQEKSFPLKKWKESNFAMVLLLSPPTLVLLWVSPALTHG